MFHAPRTICVVLAALVGCGAISCAPSLPAPQTSAGIVGTEAAIPVAPAPTVITPVLTPSATPSLAQQSQPQRSLAAKEEPMGALVIDDLPSDTAELYEDDVPMTYDVGEAKPIAAGIHVVSVVVATRTVWASKITIVPGGTVHVHIPPKYLTAYQD